MGKPEPIFVNGLSFYRVDEHITEKMPWMKGKLVLNVNKIIEFIKDQRAKGNISARGDIHIDLKESKNSTLYLQVNTWKSPETKKVEEVKQDIRDTLTSKGVDGEEINPADIPFN